MSSFWLTGPYATLQAADLYWIVGPGCTSAGKFWGNQIGQGNGSGNGNGNSNGNVNRNRITHGPSTDLYG